MFVVQRHLAPKNEIYYFTFVLVLLFYNIYLTRKGNVIEINENVFFMSALA